MKTTSSEIILEAKNLSKYFKSSGGGVFNRQKGVVKAVDDVTFQIHKGETVGLVGESGCGKTTVGRTLVKLYEPTSGEIIFQGEDISKYNRKKMKPLRSKMQMIFQDPYASLNPRWTVESIVGEPLREHQLVTNVNELQSQVTTLLESVGLSSQDLAKYPHQFSGGQRQRISIARALATAPEFLVCDEPTSALDVSVQA